MRTERFKCALLSALLIASLMALAIPRKAEATFENFGVEADETAILDLSVNIYPSDDAFVDSQDDPGQNYGSENWIAVNLAGSNKPESTWLKFDLSSIPSSATVTSAIFKAYAYQIWWSDKRSAALWDVTTNDWSESTITADNAPWDNRGAKISSDILGSVPGWWEWDVTSWVNTHKGTIRSAWLSNAWSVGITHYGQYYYSKEYANAAFRPYLEVTYLLPVGAEASILPDYQENLPGGKLEYTVTVKNTGDFPDNYILTVEDNAGWDLKLSSENWWNPNWGRRREITASGQYPENYQFRFEVNYDNNMNDDFSDLRFTEDENGDELSYWIENYVANENAIVWVRKENNSDGDLWMYYGNPGASSASDPEATFKFFDDFDSGLSKWTNFGTPSPATFQDSSFNDNWGYSTNGDSAAHSGSYSSLIDISWGIRVYFRVKQLSGNMWDYIEIGIGWEQSGYSEVNFPTYFRTGVYGKDPNGLPGDTDDIAYREYWGSEYIENGANDHEFHIFMQNYNAENNEIKFFKDDNFIVALTTSARAYDNLPLLIHGRDSNDTNYLDYILAAGYVDPEPDINFGSEELYASFENVMPGENRMVTLSVIIPENATPCTEDNITVIVVGSERPCVAVKETWVENPSTQQWYNENEILGVEDNNPAYFNIYNGWDDIGYTVVEFPVIYQGGAEVEVWELNGAGGNGPESWIFASTDAESWGERIDTWTPTAYAGAELSDYDNYKGSHTVRVGKSFRFLKLGFCAAGYNGNQPSPSNYYVGSILVRARAENSCTAHAIAPWTGTATFKLENLYAVSVDKDLQLRTGSKLVVKFYTYGNAYENENVVETFSPPWHVEENESARHPENGPVMKARLDLTTDDTQDVISTIASFTVTRNVLFGRLTAIYLEWPFASNERKNVLFAEISDIYLQWPFAPP